ncbi:MULTISPECIES: PIN-like domain-containing protein [Gluconobacter]|uniref:VapC45 PIN like domain-containing protein n=1 Tax=Gluconobacter thailandicus TaxID=257438 RepID=A0AAP9JHK5_GLUTH|nr:DUF5615 family PIN-like protein [Gluconobacter thailandicus]KXV35160.1 hypothetical protein AD940_04085 [Gluconobacter thailandicus]QEH95821.1 hypothetical protein FXF46_05660 [Gluconobacter thailandicus]
MRFVFDENHPPPLARMLAEIAKAEPYDIASVVSLGLRGTKDTDLFRLLTNGAEGRNILITADAAMKRRRHEAAAIQETGLIVVVCARGWNQERDIFRRGAMLLQWWRQIVTCSEDALPGTFLELPWKSRGVGKLARWKP